MQTCRCINTSGPCAPTCNQIASVDPAHLAEHHSSAGFFLHTGYLHATVRVACLTRWALYVPPQSASLGLCCLVLPPIDSALLPQSVISPAAHPSPLSAAFARLSGRCRLQMRSCTRGSYDNGLTAALSVCVCLCVSFILVSFHYYSMCVFFSVSPSAWLRRRGGATQRRPLVNQPRLCSSPNTQRG